VYEQPEFPILGLSPFGASLAIGFVIALFFSFIAGGTLTPFFASLGSLAALVVLLFFTIFFTSALWICNFGQQRDRLTPAQRWDAVEEKRKQHRAEMQQRREDAQAEEEAANGGGGANGGSGNLLKEMGDGEVLKLSQVAPMPGVEPDLSVKKEIEKGIKDKEDGEDNKAKKYCSCCVGLCCCPLDSDEEEELLKKGVDKDGLSPDVPRPDPQPVTTCMHNGYAPVLGSWVADLHIVYPNGSIISSYLKQRALMGKIQVSRFNSTLNTFASSFLLEFSDENISHTFF
jgi:hypothetical protein